MVEKSKKGDYCVVWHDGLTRTYQQCEAACWGKYHSINEKFAKIIISDDNKMLEEYGGPFRFVCLGYAIFSQHYIPESFRVGYFVFWHDGQSQMQQLSSHDEALEKYNKISENFAKVLLEQGRVKQHHGGEYTYMAIGEKAHQMMK